MMFFSLKFGGALLFLMGPTVSARPATAMGAARELSATTFAAPRHLDCSLAALRASSWCPRKGRAPGCARRTVAVMDEQAVYEFDARHGYAPYTDGPVDPRDRQSPFGRRRHALWAGRGERLPVWPTLVWAAGVASGFVAAQATGHGSWARAGYSVAALALVLCLGPALTRLRRLVGPLPTAEGALVNGGGALAALATSLLAPPVAVLVAPAAVLGVWLAWLLMLLAVPAPRTPFQWVSMCAWAEDLRRHPEDGLTARLFGGSPAWSVFDPLYGTGQAGAKPLGRVRRFRHNRRVAMDRRNAG